METFFGILALLIVAGVFIFVASDIKFRNNKIS